MRRFIKVGLWLGALASVAVFWRQPLVVFGLHLLIFALLNMLTDWRYLKLAVFCGLAGAISEVVAIHYGAWAYANRQLGPIPVWLPLLWAIAAVCIANLAAHFGNSKRV